MKKTLIVALSFLVATVSFSTNSGSSNASAPAASSTTENKSGISASFNEFDQLPEAPSVENRVAELSEKFANNSSSEMTKAEQKQLKKEIKSVIKTIKKEELKADVTFSDQVLSLGIIGLVILLVGALLNIGIIYLIGSIVIIVALVMFILENI